MISNTFGGHWQHAPAGCQALGVAGELHLHISLAGAPFFGFNDARSPVVDIEQLVGDAKAAVEWELPEGYTTGSVDVVLTHVADVPAYPV